MKWLKCCKNQCSRSQAVSGWVWTPFCVILWGGLIRHASVRSCPGKPNQRKGQNEKFMNLAHSCEFWCFSLGKQARFTLNFCSGIPLWKVHELAFFWFGLPGWLLTMFLKRAFRHARVRFWNARFRPSKLLTIVPGSLGNLFLSKATPGL